MVEIKLRSMTHLPEVAHTACTRCDTDPCICVDLRTYAETRRIRLASNGLRHAQGGDFEYGLLALRESLTLGMNESWVHEAAGLCALATGDVRSARESWEAATKVDTASPAIAWLSSLKGGPIRSALESYDRALNAALASDYQTARNKLATSSELLPDFVPTRRLSEVLDSRNLATARGVRRRPSYHSHMSMSWTVGGVVTAGVVALSLLMYRSVKTGSQRQQAMSRAAAQPGDKQFTVSSRVMQSTSPNAALDLATAVSLALGDNPDSLAAAIVRADVRTTAWPADVRQRAAVFRVRVARRHFNRALRARSAGLNSSAVTEFATAAELGVGTYLEDDALYEMARSQVAAGARPAASATAQRLLDLYPRSIYANSTMKALTVETAGSVRK